MTKLHSAKKNEPIAGGNGSVGRSKQRYWLSYDLGLRGNYDLLYEWLDSIGARECGTSVATFQTDFSVSEIELELKRLLDENARIYLIRKDGHVLRGGFILGKRRKSSWTGYSIPQIEQEDVSS